MGEDMTKETFGILISCIGLFLTLFSGIKDISLKNNISEKKWRRISFLLRLTDIIFLFGIICFIFSYDFEDQYKGLSEEKLLGAAEKYFKMGDYLEAMKIYSGENLETNSIALNNMAYMYENGYGINKDLNRATDLYSAAAKLDTTIAINNYTFFVLQHPKNYRQILNVLQEGYDARSVQVAKFCASYMEGYSDNITEEEYFALAEKFLNLTNQEKIQKIDMYTYTLDIPASYYFGILDSTFVTYSYEKQLKTCWTGSYEVTGYGDDRIVQPIMVEVETTIAVAHEKKIGRSDMYETQFIYVQQEENN